MTKNRTHVLMTQFLYAATELHTVMCRLGDDHGLQRQLLNAMHSVLIGAEECRQELGAPTPGPKDPDDDIPF